VNTFYATFIPGLQNFIAEVIKERLADVKINKLLDGAVLFETETSYDKLNFFCFNNIFAIISIIEGANASNGIEKHIKTFLNENCEAQEIIANNSKKISTFRIVASIENQPVVIDEKLKNEAEKLISRLSGLKINRSLPDTEFWFLFRNEEKSNGKNFSVFMKRLTIRPSWEKTLHRGELPPPLAWTLCRLARLSHGDTVLDPFCGYGSIPETAMKHFHVTKFTACDSDKKAASYTNARFKKRKEGFVFHQTDFEALPSLVAEKSIDAIVTDPPWGQYKEIDENRFLEKMFEVFAKLLKQGGRAVVLYANQPALNDSLLKASSACFKAEKIIPILLSGKKAAIYQFSLLK
jgi:tRNA G10  N-methylase Trm11